jgi:CheY-like chemotaxis protein
MTAPEGIPVKKILVIDESRLFRDFLARKLTEFGFEVIIAVNGLDGGAKLRSETPDLVIMDYYLSRTSSIDLLRMKRENPNTAEIPVIIASGKVDRYKLEQAARYNVRKFFSKPIRIDALAKTISELLGVSLEIDSTPGVIEAHLNDGILFVEIAQGLNKEKIELLRYRILELLQLYDVKSPPVLVIMSSLDVGPADTIKLSVLFQTVLESTRTRPQRVKVLTNSAYVRKFVHDTSELEMVEVTDSFEYAMDGLLGRAADVCEDKGGHHEFLKPSSTRRGREESIDIRFQDEHVGADRAHAVGPSNVAIVDDDFVIREMVKAVLGDLGPTIHEFENGREFITDPNRGSIDLVFLDLMMPVMDGFEVMDVLRSEGARIPVIVLSALSQRDSVFRAMQLGVTSYLIKPLQPESILNKARDALHANF